MTNVTGHRLVCQSCAHTKEWVLMTKQGVPVPRTGPTLWGFDLDLWLQVPCCGETLWAYNAEHLSFLEELIEAKLRERRPDPEWGWRNSSIESRLPQWMLSAKNRSDVLKALNLLKRKIVA